MAQLFDYLDQGHLPKYVFFWGHQEQGNRITKSCFSQWYEAPFEESGHRFPTAEHCMMYHKALLFGDDEACQNVLGAKSPGAAKAIGRTVKGFDQNTWDENRFNIVVRANKAKFSQNTCLGEFLQNTGHRVLVEASPLDGVWGIGLAQDDAASKHPREWRGLNLLGFALMAVRDALRESV